MKKILTEIEIDASTEKVWNALVDFEQYPEWNPFIIAIIGKPILGEKLDFSLANNGKTTRLNAKVVQIENKRRFAWKGKLLMSFLFYGHHYFEIKEKTPESVTFIHGENFGGILSGIILGKVGKATKKGFEKMNEALKAYTEK